jgi:hypothetical protein
MEDSLKARTLKHLWRFETRWPMYCPTPSRSNWTPGTSTLVAPPSPGEELIGTVGIQIVTSRPPPGALAAAMVPLQVPGDLCRCALPCELQRHVQACQGRAQLIRHVSEQQPLGRQ